VQASCGRCEWVPARAFDVLCGCRRHRLRRRRRPCGVKCRPPPMTRSCCPTRSPASRRRRSSAPATRGGAGSVGRARRRTDAIAGLRPDGRFVLMGFEAKRLPLSPADLIMRRMKIVGSQQNGREYLYEALDYAADGKVKAMAETYALAEANKAYDRV